MNREERQRLERVAYLSKVINVEAADNQRRKEQVFRQKSRAVIVNTLKVLVQHSCTEKEIIMFLGKYAKRYDVSLTSAMITHFIQTTKPKDVRKMYESIKINPNWDSAKRFLKDDVKTLKEFGFTGDEISKTFDSLLLEEYFTRFEKKLVKL